MSGDPLDTVWYVAYGSNLSRRRLQRYLDQCAPVEPPLADVATTLPHRLHFTRWSRQWGGAAAFIDPRTDDAGTTLARAWLLRRRQFESILGQENAGDPIPLVADDLLLGPGSGRVVSTGWYGLLLGCPAIDGGPALTFTTTDHPLQTATVPSTSYVDTIVEGLCDAHGLSRAAAHDYLRRRGAAPPTISRTSSSR